MKNKKNCVYRDEIGLYNQSCVGKVDFFPEIFYIT